MKASRPSAARDSIVALALTWDGRRWPMRLLPVRARSFLSAAANAAPSPADVAALFESDAIRELRICWVPRLRGGEEGLTIPFPTPAGKRIAFRMVQTVPFGDVLGVVYRR